MGVKQVNRIKRTTQQMSVIMQKEQKKKNKVGFVLPGDDFLFRKIIELCLPSLDRQSAGSTFRHNSSRRHTHSLVRSQTCAADRTCKKKGVHGAMAASDQPPPFLVVFQVEGATRGAVLHWQRVGAY